MLPLPTGYLQPSADATTHARTNLVRNIHTLRMHCRWCMKPRTRGEKRERLTFFGVTTSQYENGEGGAHV